MKGKPRSLRDGHMARPLIHKVFLVNEEIMKLPLFRVVFWTEIGALLLITFVLLMPLKFGTAIFALNPHKCVDIYYFASLITLFLSQIGYFHPIYKLRIINIAVLLGGSLLFLAVAMFWFMRAEGLSLDFSELYRGELIGPIVASIALPTIQAFVSMFSVSTVRT